MTIYHSLFEDSVGIDCQEDLDEARRRDSIVRNRMKIIGELPPEPTEIYMVKRNGSS